MTIKYEYLLCKTCLAAVRKANDAEAKRRRLAGESVGGRPKKALDARVLRDVLNGTLTIPQAAKRLRVSGNTVRRRLARLQTYD
jgi:hypothetical protein